MNGRRCKIGAILIAAGVMVADRGVVLGQTTTAPVSYVPSSTSTADGCVSDYDATAGIDYFPDKAVIDYAQTFSVEYFPAYKVLNIYGDVYVLYQCGTPEPTLADNVSVQQFVSVPVNNVATGTPDHIPRIEVCVDIWCLCVRVYGETCKVTLGSSFVFIRICQRV